LDQEWFGIFTLSILVLTTVAEMSDLGLNGGLLRFAPYYIANKQTEKLKQLLKLIWKWRIYLSLILTIGGIALSWPIARYIFNQVNLTPYIAFSFVGVGGVVLLGFVVTYLQAAQKFKSNSVINALKGLCRLAIVLVLIFCGINNLYLILSAYIYIPWALFFVAFKFLPQDFLRVNISEEDRKIIGKQLSGFSFWLAVWSLSSIIAGRIDQAVLSGLLGLSSVAIYAVAFQFIYFFSLGSQAITAVLMPKVNSLSDKKQLKQFLWMAAKRIIPIIIVGLILIYPSKYLILLFFGDKYMQSMASYVILGSAMLISFVSIPLSIGLMFFNKTKLVAVSGFLQLIANLVFNFLLIPILGVEGAAWTFFIGVIISIIYNMIVFIYLYKKESVVIN
jgi:O-antigen/teichoic acid export membrane protein